MFKRFLNKTIAAFSRPALVRIRDVEERLMLAVGTLLINQQKQMVTDNFNDFEFRIFSQWGDDGLIQYLIHQIPISQNSFIEFGVEDYRESNTRFLLFQNSWTGFVIDGSASLIRELRAESWYWRYPIQSHSAFIDKDNINSLMKGSGLRDIGILSIDIDGNDYHVLSELDFVTLNPSILIVEYNSLFGPGRAITVPYRKDFVRSRAHYSNLFYGASLRAITQAANDKGYGLIGSNMAGNNAYFVRRDLLNAKILEVTPEIAYKASSFREGRKSDGSLAFFSPQEAMSLLKGMKVLNVLSGDIEEF